MSYYLDDDNSATMLSANEDSFSRSCINKSEQAQESLKKPTRRSNRQTKQKNVAQQNDDDVSTTAAAPTSKKKKKKPAKEKEPTKTTTSAPVPANTSSNASSMSRSAQQDLKKIILDSFGYALKEKDMSFITDLYSELPVLNDIWDRIGFKPDIKQKRLNTFYSKLMETYQGIIANEQDLEDQILETIEEQKEKLEMLCIELKLKHDEVLKQANLKSTKLSVLEEDELLRNEIKRLEAEKSKRLEEYHALATSEAKLCDKLVVKKSEKRVGIPSDPELVALKARIKDLEKLLRQRIEDMGALKEEIVSLSEDLDMSGSDSFAEIILFESVDVMSLGEADLNRAVEFRDGLVKKNNEVMDEIRSLRVKIKELWSKLKCENLNMKLVVENGNSAGLDMPKRTILHELRKEHERCVQIKMENMQKFIEGVRIEILALCEKMFIGVKEMKLMDHLFKSVKYDEDLLKQHEEKLEDLQFRHTESEGLYEKMAKWIELWNQFIEFEEKTKDPLRLKQRGYNMLEEERQRKAFNSALPKLEDELVGLAKEYERNTGGQVFMIYDDPFAEFIYKKKLDHEDNKQNQRKEKQIMRDTIKKNESRFGSKPATPLALRQKRKLVSNHDTQAPMTPGLSRVSKLQRTDLMTSTASHTPGSTFNGTKLTIGTSKNKLTAKRKSRTPGKNKLRRSRIMAAAKAAANNEATMMTESDQADTTVKTTLSSIASSLSNLTANSTGTGASKLYSSKAQTSTLSTASNGSTAKKYPPMSASSKFTTINKPAVSCLTRMTSTASNTFIEEENLDDLENYPDYSCFKAPKQDENNKATLHAAAAKINKLVQNGNTVVASRFGFQFQEDSKLTSCVDVNYMEFSRDLPKPVRFGASQQQNLDASNLTQLSQLSSSSKPSTRSASSSKYKA